MTKTFDTIESVAGEIGSKLRSDSDKKKIVLLYAFNGVGKTRLSTTMHDALESKDDQVTTNTLSYNAFFEDLFTWDNDEYLLNFNSKSNIITFISDQGLENQITDNFQILTRSKIYPSYDLDSGHIAFNFAPGDDRSESNIKISRGEESLFVWSVFFTVLEAAILALGAKEEDRETELFNGLEYVIIDDPVSSIDDTKIITMVLELLKLIDSHEGNSINFLITTHHALFFNILYSEYSRNPKVKLFPFLLSKHATDFSLDEQNDSPFAYHLAIKDEIQRALDSQDLKKYHFNLFRGLLEKTANFLGYRSWGDCLDGEDKREIMRLVNLYSHGRLSDLESTHFPDEHKDTFRKVFESFVERWKPLATVPQVTVLGNDN
ncbi:MAG: AAA family ATPase [Candidatus Pacebacteria bacterium]|nr:AAA family ATPase [Candidatus Paceibacterota bacterium]